MQNVKLEYLWNDRIRHFGLPLSFTRYALSADRLFISKGFLNITDEEILLYRITDISSSQNLIQRLFGVGSITVQSSDKTCPTLVIKNIKDHRNVKELFHQTVETMKIQRHVRLGEFTSSISGGALPDTDGDGIPDIYDND